MCLYPWGASCNFWLTVSGELSSSSSLCVRQKRDPVQTLGWSQHVCGDRSCCAFDLPAGKRGEKGRAWKGRQTGRRTNGCRPAARPSEILQSVSVLVQMMFTPLPATSKITHPTVHKTGMLCASEKCTKNGKGIYLTPSGHLSEHF